MSKFQRIDSKPGLCFWKIPDRSLCPCLKKHSRAHPPDVDRPAQNDRTNEKHPPSIRSIHATQANRAAPRRGSASGPSDGRHGRPRRPQHRGRPDWPGTPRALPRFVQLGLMTFRPTRRGQPADLATSGPVVYKSHTHAAVSLKLKPTSANEIDKAKAEEKLQTRRGEGSRCASSWRWIGSAAPRCCSASCSQVRSRSRSLPVALFCFARSVCSRSSIRGGRG